jgi:hypothetical protein
MEYHVFKKLKKFKNGKAAAEKLEDRDWPPGLGQRKSYARGEKK